ncbi:MAG: NAD(P)/FAD-dependent oxidoreductase [Candidatus Syntropharchaeales archaeon]
MIDEYDILIVGAGFAGLSAAISASKDGAKTLLVSPALAKTIPDGEAGLDLLGIGPKTAAAFEKVADCSPPYYIATHGFKYISPEGRSFTDRSKEERGWTLMTTEATQILLKKAVVNGSDYIKSPVIYFLTENGKVEGVMLGDGRMIKSKVVICACGYNPNLIEKLGVKPPEESLFALQTIVEMEKEGDEHLLFTFFCGKKWSDSLGGFLMPVSRKKAVVALGVKSREDAHRYLLRVIKEHPVLSKAIKWNPGRMYGGLIPLGLTEKSFGDGFLLVGDAAGHFRPVGGVGTGNALIFGDIAGKIGAKAASEGDSSSERLQEFEEEWKKSPEGQKLIQAIPYSKVLREADDGLLEDAFSAFEGREIGENFYLELIREVSERLKV